jgi:coiled-coil domain-containing protein 61
MSGELDETANVTLRDVKYIASWRMENDLLSVCLEEQDTAQRWRGDFSSAYVEEMTHKTGNFKKFPIFVKMLASSLRHVVPHSKPLPRASCPAHAPAQTSLPRPMMNGNVPQQSDSVYIDLLTHADLEALKSRHAKAPAAKPAPVGKSNKRYLILTCAPLRGA